MFWENLALPSVEKKVRGSWLQLPTTILQRRRRRDTHSFCYCFFRGNVLVRVWARGQPSFISQSSMKLPGSESIGTLRLLPAHACNRSCCFHCAAGWGWGAPGWGDAAGLTLQPGCYGLIAWNRAPPRHVREMKGVAPPLPLPRDDRGERRPDPSGTSHPPGSSDRAAGLSCPWPGAQGNQLLTHGIPGSSADPSASLLWASVSLFPSHFHATS